MSDILYATTFSKDLYEATGRRMLQSFARVCPGDRMLVAYEGDIRDDFLAISPFLLPHDLARDPMLTHWLHDNRDVIPDYLGGEMKECRCPGREKRHAKHKPGCRFDWMNRNASRFFRKVVAQYAALQYAKRYLIWVDSDCEFHQPMTVEVLKTAVLGKSGVAYCRGRRPGTETGIVAYDLKQGGADFIKALAARFMTKEFRKFPRWDDGAVFSTLLDEKRYRTVDLVKKDHKDNNVIPTTIWKDYIEHRKGSHGTRLGVMR